MRLFNNMTRGQRLMVWFCSKLWCWTKLSCVRLSFLITYAKFIITDPYTEIFEVLRINPTFWIFIIDPMSVSLLTTFQSQSRISVLEMIILRTQLSVTTTLINVIENLEFISTELKTLKKLSRPLHKNKFFFIWSIEKRNQAELSINRRTLPDNVLKLAFRCVIVIFQG